MQKRTEKEISEQREIVEQALGNPKFIQLDETTLKTRRNLLVTSTLSIFVSFSDFKIGETFKISGLVIEGIQKSDFEILLLVITIYFLVHFVWQTLDIIFEWLNRLTGLFKQIDMSGFTGISGREFAEDLTKTSLSTWFLEKVQLIKLTKASLEGVVFDDHQSTQNTLNSLHSYFGSIANAINEERIFVSLIRFDKNFTLFQWSQIFRFSLLEFGLPVALGLWSIFAMTMNIADLDALVIAYWL